MPIPVTVLLQIVTLAAELASPLRPTEISGGTPVDPGEYPEVVRIGARFDACTGVMVSDRIALTAAHCIDDVRSYENVTVAFGEEANGDDRIPAIRWAVEPRHCPECDDDQHDIGFVELEYPVSTPRDYPRPLVAQQDWDAYVNVGGQVELVGYGADSEANIGNQDAWIKRVAAGQISSLSSTGREFWVGEDGGAAACDGDSGGPAYVIDEHGRRKFVGLASRGFGCGEGAAYTVAFHSLCWLRDDADLDLLPAGCDRCDCLDTEQPRGCSVDPASAGSWWFLGLIPLVVRRRMGTEGRRSGPTSKSPTTPQPSPTK